MDFHVLWCAQQHERLFCVQKKGECDQLAKGGGD